MNMRLLLFLLVSINVSSSCNNTAETRNVTDKESNEVMASGSMETTQCYLGLPGKDSVFLQIRIDNNTVYGDLEYKRFQKDRNKGTIKGMFRGDTLLADYTFMSEGVMSVREVIFLRKGDVLIEGFGDVKKKNEKMVFKNTGDVRFDEFTSLKQNDCRNEEKVLF